VNSDEKVIELMASLRTPIQIDRPGIPPLEPSDRLTRDEFERRYHAMPDDLKAELIVGVVYIASSVRYRSHGKPHIILSGLLLTYSVETENVETADNATTRLDLDNEPQADLLMFVDPQAGGRIRISDNGDIENGPELVAEIASSPINIDLHAKLNAYRKSGVCEYLVWRVRDNEIDFLENVRGEFVPILPESDGVLKSRQFPSLWIDKAALLEGRFPDALKTLRAGIATDAHRHFVSSLSDKLKVNRRNRSDPGVV